MDLAPADAEDLAYGLVRGKCYLLWVGDELAVPDPDHVVDLRLAELLHWPR